MEVFKDYAYYYNMFYQDKDYEFEAKQIKDLLEKNGQKISSIINLGCGTGKHDVELTKLGYQCTGIDLSNQMIEVAREYAVREGVDIKFIVGDIRNFKAQEKYDAAISLFHVMSYQNSNYDILAAFETARNLLNKNGIFVFDIWYGPGVLSDKPVVRIKEIEDENNRLVRIARPVMHDKENVVEVYYEMFIIEKKSGRAKVINEKHSMRYFFRPELEYFLKEAGFELINNLDCKNLGVTNFDTWTSYFIAKVI